MKIHNLLGLIALLIAAVACRTYPMQKQCNPQWGTQQYADTTLTICQKGSCLASISMALSGIGKPQNPGTLNTWLKQNDGYYSGTILLRSIEKLGLIFEGRLPNSSIKKALDEGKVVICSVARQ